MMAKTEVKKMLPYNTISKCEKAYREETQKTFDFSGLDAEKIEIIKSCVYNIYSSVRNDSIAQKEKFFAGKENRRKSYEAYINREYEKMYELLFA